MFIIEATDRSKLQRSIYKPISKGHWFDTTSSPSSVSPHLREIRSRLWIRTRHPEAHDLVGIRKIKRKFYSLRLRVIDEYARFTAGWWKGARKIQLYGEREKIRTKTEREKVTIPMQWRIHQMIRSVDQLALRNL